MEGSAQWGGRRQWVRRVWRGQNKHARLVCVCVFEESAAVIAREAPCARRTLKLIKGGDRVIIHYGPLERLTLKSLLLINSETVLRINNNIKKGTERRSANTFWIDLVQAF